MLKPQRLLARRPLDQLPKQRLRALKPRDRARIGPWRAGLLAAHRPPITIHASQRWFAHRAVSLPGAIEQVEQIWSHAITSVPRSERDITSRLSAPPPRTPSETPRSNPGKSTRPRATRRRSGAIYPLQTTCTLVLCSRLEQWLARCPCRRLANLRACGGKCAGENTAPHPSP